jgi:hypothetical protein
LSYHFGGESVGYGGEGRKYLELLGVTVITGEDYEPRPVNEKVRGRLEGKIDLVVIEEPTGGQLGPAMKWRRRNNPGVALIPLAENDAAFDQGIFGDYECIRLERGHIGDSFIRLLQKEEAD